MSRGDVDEGRSVLSILSVGTSLSSDIALTSKAETIAARSEKEIVNLIDVKKAEKGRIKNEEQVCSGLFWSGLV